MIINYILAISTYSQNIIIFIEFNLNILFFFHHKANIYHICDLKQCIHEQKYTNNVILISHLPLASCTSY